MISGLSKWAAFGDSDAKVPSRPDIQPISHFSSFSGDSNVQPILRTSDVKWFR